MAFVGNMITAEAEHEVGARQTITADPGRGPTHHCWRIFEKCSAQGRLLCQGQRTPLASQLNASDPAAQPHTWTTTPYVHWTTTAGLFAPRPLTLHPPPPHTLDASSPVLGASLPILNAPLSTRTFLAHRNSGRRRTALNPRRP